MAEEKVTEEQVTEALQQLTFPSGNESEIQKPETPEPEPSTEEATTPEVEPVAEKAKPEGAVEEVEAVEDAPQEDDLKSLNESLKARLEEKDRHHKEQVDAITQRSEKNFRIQQDRYLRKATASDRAAKIIEAALSEEGVSQEEAKRVVQELRGTMHPSSASYVEPSSASVDGEEQEVVFNLFSNEKGMTMPEQNEFLGWIKKDGGEAMSLAEQNVVNQSLDGFLRIAHNRWQEGMREKEKENKRNDAKGAVESVKRTQREAAKAASVSPAAPKKQPTGQEKEIDYKSLTHDDISTLLRQTVTDNR